MEPFAQLLHKYCEAHTSPASPILDDLERETYLKTLSPNMISGHLQGQFLKFLVQISGAKRVLEIGTFTGYAAICFASGLGEDGLVHTIEANGELEHIIRKYLQKSGMEEKVVLHMGDAKSIIPTLTDRFDIVFIDAGKIDYTYYYDVVFDKVNINGLILADNVLWSGKVVKGENDQDTKTIRAFNKIVQQDERVENVMLPVRDGIMIARKIRE